MIRLEKFKFNLTSKAFILIITLYFSFLLNLTFWRRVATDAEVTTVKGFFWLTTLPFTMIVLHLFVFSLFFLPKIGKPIVIFFLLCSACADYAMFNLGISVDSDMVINIVQTNVREGLDFLNFRSVVWVVLLGIVPAALITLSKVKFAPLKNELKFRSLFVLVSLLVVGVGVGVFSKEYASFGRNNANVKNQINIFNYVRATVRYNQRMKLANREFLVLDDAPVLSASRSAKKQIFVVVVGETARAKNFSLLGYERETNPLLAKRDLTVFAPTVSCGTYTAVSVPCMFSNMNRANFNMVDAEFSQNLVDIAKLAGYDVFWLDNDDGCKKVCNRVESEELRGKESEKFCFGDFCHDEVALERLAGRIADARENTLLLFHMMGSHGPSYYKRYPEAFKRFTPTCDNVDLQSCSSEEILNTYDNTILYTDFVLNELIGLLEKAELDAKLLYVSDHGESLGEKNVYLHGFPYALAPREQTEVPMFLWEKNKTLSACGANLKSYSHDNLFHSLLSALGIESKLYNKNLDMFGGCVASAF